MTSRYARELEAREQGTHPVPGGQKVRLTNRHLHYPRIRSVVIFFLVYMFSR